MKKNKNNMSFEEDILLLQEKGGKTSLSIGEIFSILSEKGLALIILFLCLPFCQPIQIPGFSTPFGIAIIFIGLKMSFGTRIELPKKIAEKSIDSNILQKIIGKILWVLDKTDPLIHPRLIWLCYHPSLQVINGLLIILLGLLLALPIPVPLSNLVAAWSILFIGLGLLKDDGVFIIIGHVAAIFTFVYFILLAIMIRSLLIYTETH